MISLSYMDETNRLVRYELLDWDAVHVVAHALVNAPIDVQYLDYVDGSNVGVFNLKTFERT